MRSFLFSLVISLTFISKAPAAKKTTQEYWKEVDWKFSDMLEPVLEDNTCYKSEKDFLACMYSLNAMISPVKRGLSLVPTERVNSEKGFGKAEETFGPLSLVSEKKLTSDSLAEIYDFNKKQQALTNKAWAKLYADKQNSKVLFKDIKDWLTKQKGFTDEESYVTSLGVNAILAIVLDPHTRYTPTAEMDETLSTASENFVGIGVTLKVLTKNGKKVFLVDAPIEGSPALAAGIKSGDIIQEVDGKSLENSSLDELSSLIRGPKGTTVKLTILRQGVSKTVSIVRGEIKVVNVASSLLTSNNVSVGHIKFKSFMKTTGCKEIANSIKDLETKGAKALIFDLRANGGGLLTEAVCISNLFLEKKKLVVSIKSLQAGLSDRDLKTTDEPITKLPVITLINSRSASASELVSGALQDHKRSYIIGDRSFGKGTVQSQFRKDKVILLKTIARFHLPSGRTNQIKGIIPDVYVPVVPNPTKDDLVAFREEDEYAAISELGDPWKQPRPDQVKELTKCMTESGSAAETYKKNLANAIAPDYQLLNAQDAATCLANGKPTDTEKETPMISYAPLKEPASSAVREKLKEQLKDLL